MKILITGSTGLLGQALSRKLAPRGELTGLSRHAPEAAAARHIVCDLRDRARTAEAVRGLQPDVVIHAQAFSDVDRCEQEPVEAEAMNIGATANLLEALQGSPAWLIHISSDYVFDGTRGRPYDEADAPNPLGVYGRTKLASERLVLSRPLGFVVRVSTLFGQGRKTFCDQIVQRLRAGQTVEAFMDQTTSPSFTDDVAEGLGDLIGALQRPSLPGRILHLVNAGGCSRVEWARCVAEILGLPMGGIQAVPMARAGRAASRPAYSALTTRVGLELIGRTLRPWQEALEIYLRRQYAPAP